MRLVRFEHAGVARYGRLHDDDHIEAYSAAPWAGGSAEASAARVPRSLVKLLAPIEPTKIVCVGRNYASHAKELGNQVPSEPLIFLKPPSALLAPFEAIVIPSASQRVEHEAEIGLVIGRRLRHASVSEALSAVAGVTCVNDVTARDIQRKEVQFTRAKGFDTFCPVGPWVATACKLDALQVRGRVNGQERQCGSVGEMIFGLGALLAFISNVMTLEASDLVSTGTPEGVGPLLAGDVVEVEVDGVGVLQNPVRGPGAN